MRFAILLLALLALPVRAEVTDICDRTPQVRDAIMKMLGYEGCAAVDLAELNRFLTVEGLTSLNAGDFNGLTNLRTLNLQGNQLTTLPAGVFDELANLVTLNLQENRLTTLPAGAFDGLGSLKTLRLHNNRLATLPVELFDGVHTEVVRSTGSMPSWDLDLSNNLLTTLPVELFDGVRLQTLNLSNNRLTTLPEGAFEGAGHLQTLNLKHNRLTTLPEELFHTKEVNSNGFRVVAKIHHVNLRTLDLSYNLLTALPEGLLAGLGGDGFGGGLKKLYLNNNRLRTLPAGLFVSSLTYLHLDDNRLVTLPESLFAGLGKAIFLTLTNNHLVGLTLDDPLFAALPGHASVAIEGQTTPVARSVPTDICDRTPQVRAAILKAARAEDCAAVELAYIRVLRIDSAGLTGLKADDFAGLGRLESLRLIVNQLTTLPVGVFDGLGSLVLLTLQANRLTTLPEGLFDGLSSLESLGLGSRLTTLPEGLFDGLSSLGSLNLKGNRLTTLPEGLFAGLDNLQHLYLHDNRLTTLPDGVFDGLDRLRNLLLLRNRLTTLPEGLFDGLSSLEELDLSNNHLVGLTLDDPLFDGLMHTVELGGQTEAEGGTGTGTGTEGRPTRLVAAVPLMPSLSARQGFARIVNESDEGGVVRVFATDDGGYSPDPFEIRLEARQAFHFNADDLQGGNDAKGMDGIGAPVQGDWRLDVETALSVRVLAFVRTGDGFLTAMHDVLPRRSDGRLAALTFNPGSNDERVSKLRLVNTGDGEAEVSIEGVDDAGAVAGPVSLTLDAGHSRTLSASELEGGAHGLTGTLGDGRGKWRLRVTAPDSVVAMSLLDAASGHLSNLSTMGAAP